MMDKKGKVAIKPLYDEIVQSKRTNVLRVKKNNKYGFINQKGKVIVTPQYDYAESGFYNP